MTIAPSPSFSTHELTASVLGPFATGWTYGAAEDVQAHILLAGVRQPNLTQPGQFTLTSANPTTDGGSVTLAETELPEGGWPDGSVLVLTRRTPRRQGLALPDVEGHKPRQTEAALDRQTRMHQEAQDGLDRALSVPVGEAGIELPPQAVRDGKLLAPSGAGMAVLDTPERLVVTLADGTLGLMPLVSALNEIGVEFVDYGLWTPGDAGFSQDYGAWSA
jgi:hypothetical protein